jgi:hypothetical protein
LLTMKKPAARVSGLLCCCFCVSSQQRGSATVALQPCHTPASALLAPARRAPAFPAPACQAATALLTSAARVGGGQLLRLHRARRAGASKQLATDCMLSSVRESGHKIFIRGQRNHAAAPALQSSWPVGVAERARRVARGAARAPNSSPSLRRAGAPWPVVPGVV